jgi:hypothetical protein
MKVSNGIIPVMTIIRWVMAVGLALLGGAKMYESGKYIEDNHYEEILENAIEEGVEDTFGMPDDTLDNLIDLSPGSEDAKRS